MTKKYYDYPENWEQINEEKEEIYEEIIGTVCEDCPVIKDCFQNGCSFPNSKELLI